MKTKRWKDTIQISSMALAGLVTPAVSIAQAEVWSGAGLEEVIVTATRTGESSLRDTPIAISALDAGTLNRRGVDDIRDLGAYVPGLQVADFTGYAQVFIRGIGSNDPFAGTDPSSTMHLDGVYLGRTPSYFANFLDVERVEVLRGPQGTLYGRNSVGGTINIISRSPSETPTAEVTGVVGNYDTYGASGMVSGPIGKSARGSLALQYKSRDDYLDNISTGGDLGAEEMFGLRGQLLIPMGEKITATLRADYAEQDNNLVAYAKLLGSTGLPSEDVILGDYEKVSLNLPNRQEIETSGVALELNYAPSERTQLKSLTSWRQLESTLDFDADASSLNIGRTYVALDQDQFSQDITFTATYDHLTWLAGAFFYQEDVDEPLLFTLREMGFSNFRIPTIETRSYAFYTQLEYSVSEAVSLVAGVRHTRERKEFTSDFLWTASASMDFDTALAAPAIGAPFFYDPFSVDAAATHEAWTPKFGINYRPSDNTLVYVSATRGFKSGGYDMGSTSQETAENGFSPEYLWAYELGVKGGWLDDRLSANIAAFYYDYEDLQVTLFQPPANAITQNAASAKSKGFEAEFQARPIEPLTLFGNIAYLDATYSDYPSAFSALLGPFDASDQRLNNAPEWAFTLGALYRVQLASSGELFIGADYHWQDEIYFSPINDGIGGVSGYLEQQEEYGLLNARIGWESEDGGYGVTLVGSNLLDEEYIVSSANYTAAIAGRPGLPRMLEARFSVKW